MAPCHHKQCITRPRLITWRHNSPWEGRQGPLISTEQVSERNRKGATTEDKGGTTDPNNKQWLPIRHNKETLNTRNNRADGITPAAHKAEEEVVEVEPPEGTPIRTQQSAS